MKILIINPTGGSPYHGPNLRSYNLAKNLNLRNCKTTIIANSYFHKFYNLPVINNWIDKELIDNIEYYWIKSIRYKSRGFLQILNQIIFAIRLRFIFDKFRNNKFDVIIYSSPTPFAIISGVQLAKKFKCKLIFEIRDLWPMVIQEIGNFSNFHPLIMILNWFEKYAYKNSDHIVSVKPGDINYIKRKYGIENSKLSYIPNGYDIKNLFTKKPPNNITSSFKKDKFIVGYMGSLSAAYGIDQLIKAAEILKDDDNIQFVIAGDGPAFIELKNYILVNNLSNVSFLGRIPNVYVSDVIKNFSVCFVGYKKANWLKHGLSSNKIYDYMAQKKPIIAALDSDYDPIKLANCGITVDPENPKQLAEAIDSMKKNNYSHLKNLGYNGYNYLLKNHNFEKISSSYINLFKSLREL